jgi:hypothetical protein
MDAARTWFVIAALIELVLWAIVALRPVPEPAGKVLRYGRKMRWFGLAAAFLIPMLLITMMLASPQTGWLKLFGANLLVMGLIAGVPLLETQKTRIAVTDAGVVGYSPWRRPRDFAWSDIQGVTYSVVDHCLILHGTGRRTIRASLFLVNIGELTRAIKEKVPADRYASAIRRFK